LKGSIEKESRYLFLSEIYTFDPSITRSWIYLRDAIGTGN